jgi:leucyl aminopeptidase (aminopeptidase T)
MILPAGEIATYPESINGKLVADGAIHANVVTSLDVRLRDHPLTIEIEDSQAVSVGCDDGDVLHFVEACFDRPNVRRVGELGFGTNVEAGGFTAFNSHLNERLPGVHIGFGEHNQPKSIVPYEADIHLDIITDDAKIHLPRAEDTIVLSKFIAEHDIVHPALVRDEDITGDCCMNTFGELRPV